MSRESHHFLSVMSDIFVKVIKFYFSFLIYYLYEESDEAEAKLGKFNRY